MSSCVEPSSVARKEVAFLIPNEDNGTKTIAAIIYEPAKDASVTGRGTVLALHGFQDNAASFYKLGPALAAAGFTVVCVEFTGHGKSDHANTSQGAHFAYVCDVMDVVEALRVPQFHLIGHSMGAIVACLTAGSILSRVLTLIIIDSIGPFGPKSDGDAPEMLEAALQQRSSLIHRRPRVYETMDECISRWSTSPFAPQGRDNVRAIVERGVELVFDPANELSGYRFRHDIRLKSLPLFRLTEAASLSFLSRVACPVLALIANDRPEFWPEEIGRQHFKALRAHVEMVSGGHHPHMTNPAVVIPIVLEFFHKHAQSPPTKARL